MVCAPPALHCGALVAFTSFLFRPSAFNALRQPLVAWVVGVGGLFGYHALYFLALRFAPPAEAGLLNYLWPLLIVLFSSLLPGERLALHHVVGALFGLAGIALPDPASCFVLAGNDVGLQAGERGVLFRLDFEIGERAGGREDFDEQHGVEH